MDHLSRSDFTRYTRMVDQVKTVRPEGRVSQVVGLIAEGDSLGLGIGSLCSILTDQGEEVKAEVVGFKKQKALLMPYGDIRGVRMGSRIVPVSASPMVEVSDQLLGRVIYGMEIPWTAKAALLLPSGIIFTGNPSAPWRANPLQSRWMWVWQPSTA